MSLSKTQLPAGRADVTFCILSIIISGRATQSPGRFGLSGCRRRKISRDHYREGERDANSTFTAWSRAPSYIP